MSLFLWTLALNLAHPCPLQPLAWEGEARSFLADDSKALDSSLVKFKITKGKQVLKMPGERLELGAENIFEFQEGKHRYEVSITLTKIEKKKVTATLLLKHNGKTVISEDKELAPKKTAKMTKGEIVFELYVDPKGKVEGGRKKKIDISGKDLL